MKIEMRPLAEIKPYESNPRINDDAVAAVAESIRQFGFRQPIVVDEAGVVIAGHTRLKAAERLGLEQVPVHVAIGLTPEQVRAYRIADNRTAELAEWDMDLLSAELLGLTDAASTGGCWASIKTSWPSCSARRFKRACAIRTTCRCRPMTQSPRSGTCGSSASIACCAATRRRLRMSIDCLTAPQFTS